MRIDAVGELKTPKRVFVVASANSGEIFISQWTEESRENEYHLSEVITISYIIFALHTNHNVERILYFTLILPAFCSVLCISAK